MKFFLYIIILAALIYSDHFSQTDTLDIIDSDIFELKENIFENNEDISSFDLIEQLLSNPIDINKVTVEDLSKLPFLSLQDAQTIIKARNKVKYFKSFNEFQVIKGIHPDELLLLKPFLKFTFIDKPIEESKKISGYIHSRLFNNFQNQKGYLDNSYLGSKIKSYNRLGISYGNFKSRILIEKDPGEKSYTDYVSGFVQYYNSNFINKLIIGDYDFEFGQGLVVWSPYRYSKGNDALNFVSKRDRGIIPHTSTDENKFFRGAAVETKVHNFLINGFYSYNNIDASVNDLNEVTSFAISGYHRTENEISKRHNLTEQTIGASVKYSLAEFLNLSLLHMNNNFDKKLNFGEKFSLNGDNFNFTSFNYSLLFNNINVLGEISHNGESIANVTNLYLGISDEIQFVTSYRNYSKNYFNIHSSGFGETSNTQNEQGYYFGITVNSNFGRFNIYYDIFKFPYSNNANGFSSNGNDFLINYELKLFAKAKFNLKIKDEKKEIISSNNFVQSFSDQEKLNIRMNLEYEVIKTIIGKSRIEYVKFSEVNDREEGYLLYQDLKFKFIDYFSLTSRFIFFQTKSYNSRIYEFENDLRGVLSNLPLYGEGLRWYLLFNYNPSKNFYIYLKYSETYKPNEKSLGTGDSEIFSNIDNLLSLQAELRF